MTMHKQEKPSIGSNLATSEPSPSAVRALLEGLQAHRFGEVENGARAMVQRHTNFDFGWVMLAAALEAQGKVPEALAAVREAVQLSPTNADALGIQGKLFLRLERYTAAEGAFIAAIRSNPNQSAAYTNLALCQIRQGKRSEAIHSFQELVERFPKHFEGWCSLGDLLTESGDLNGAIAHYSVAAQIRPDVVAVAERIGDLCLQQKNIGLAAEHFRRALALNSASVVSLLGLAQCEWEAANLAKALPLFEQALKIGLHMPAVEARAHLSLGLIQLDQGRYKQAEQHFLGVLRIQSNHALSLCKLGFIYDHYGEVEVAARWYKQASELCPGDALAQSSYLYFMAYRGQGSQAEYASTGKRFNDCFPRSPRQRKDGRKPDGRKLRIGYVSGDFRQHAIAYFYNPLLIQHDRSRVEVFSYMTSPKTDATSEYIKAHSDNWRQLAAHDDEQAVKAIEDDGIDVLIDLSGHTGGGRLGIFAARAAPVQAHYLGYFASTGLAEMDYWIADPVLIPQESESAFTEEIWRLPRVWISYAGREDAPDIAWSPAPNGSICLGSFNNLQKLTPGTLALWAEILNQLPEAHLLLKNKALEEQQVCDRLRADLLQAGFDLARVRFMGGSARWQDHMATYNEVDVALDPIQGVGGGTTTCDALWMGVPVATLAGTRMAERMTASMLMALDQPEWVAETSEEYVELVVRLARDTEARSRLRQHQRTKMRASSLCDSKGLASDLEAAYEAMFDARMAGWPKSR